MKLANTYQINAYSNITNTDMSKLNKLDITKNTKRNFTLISRV